MEQWGLAELSTFACDIIGTIRYEKAADEHFTKSNTISRSETQSIGDITDSDS